MPSIRYVNQTAPFWDFVANLEDQGSQHPFFANPSEPNRDTNPWSWAWGAPPGPHPHAHHQHRGPPPPRPDNGEGPSSDGPPPAEDSNGEQPSGPEAPDHHSGPMPHRPHPHPQHRGPWAGCHNRRGRGHGHGPWGGRHGGPFNNFTGPFSGLADLMQNFQPNSFPSPSHTEDFHPEADVFDTESAFVVHVSLPGAKREDIGVSWDAEKSELSIGGVVYRPGDEDFLKTLAMEERRVGAFERKVRLGSRASPAQVDADMITAKLEDGVLRVEVPKLDKDYVEVKKVDIE